MMIRILKFSLLILICNVVSAQPALKSPEQYLGYKQGEKYTLHHRIISYFQSVADAVPQMVKLEKYGETYEGRPLMLTFISTPENLRNLEQTRLNNLRLAGIAKDRAAPVTNTPAIIWLSYNVHGNEPSSSEAAMKTLYTLVDPSNSESKKWLANTIVIIDPCINPDGRDRYVNWQNGSAAKVADPNPQTREHREPWPGGRINHYYFDLNRDWAWQTQIESKQRLKVYNEWLPQVHVDFHEQGINEPYYFAPAAEPYHEVITPWQRSFQTQIGRNNAKYFDEQGWLYFTRERFDLFYPSYGDTYPSYNGSIGMTYEQGGGPRGGKAVLIEGDDTLTLADRIQHHYTTGISTIEISSANAARLITEFRNYFSDGLTNGSGEYRTYVVRNTSAMGTTGGKLGDYLRNMGIDFGYAQAKAQARGYNFVSGKDEAFTINANDIIVSTFQPKANLVRVLFEPHSKLSDSATYDITAWSLPHAMGLEAYAVKEKLAAGWAIMKSAPQAEFSSNVISRAYAWVIPWTGMGSASVLAQLLKNGIKVRYAEQPFSVGTKNFERGSIIVARSANKLTPEELYKKVAEAVKHVPAFQEVITPIETGFADKGFDLGSGSVKVIKAPRVALLSGEGSGPNAVGEIWHYFEQQLDYPISMFNTSDLSSINWNSIDVLIMAYGNYRFINDKGIMEAVKNWIQQGGRLIALENAVSQLASLDWAIKRKKEDTKKEDEKVLYEPIKKYEDREKDYLRGSIPGAIYKVELDNTHPLAFGYPGYYFTLKQDDNLYDFFKQGGWNVGVIKKDNYVTGFAGVNAKAKLKDGLLIGVQEVGRGAVIYFSDDPVFRGFWENGKLMLANAVFLTENL